MNSSTRTFALTGLALVVGLMRASAGETPPAGAKTSGMAIAPWTTVRVELPKDTGEFPPGEGADIANGQCRICHSAGMVLRQPALGQDEWAGEINKMRKAFGAPIPADQVEDLARYLHAINGSRAPGASDTNNGQGG